MSERFDAFTVGGKTDTSKFEKAAAQAQKETLKWGNKFLRDGVGVYQRWMAQMAPPKLAMQKTPRDVAANPKALERLKVRRIRLIVCALRDKDFRKEYAILRKAHNEGYSWYVRGGHPAFFKSKRTETPPPRVLRAADIHYRFLLKWAFVGGLPNIGVAVNRHANWAKRFTGYRNSVRNVTGEVSQATVRNVHGGFRIKMDTSMVETNGNGRGGDWSWEQVCRKFAQGNLDNYMKKVAKKAGYTMHTSGYSNNAVA